MGIVAKQGFWTSVAAYVGAILGLINQIFVLPSFLEKEQVGLFSQIQSFAMLLAPMAILGMTATAVKFTPAFKTNGGLIRVFTTYLFLGVTLGLIVVTLLVTVFRDFILSFYEEKSPLVGEYYETGVLLIAIITFISLNEGILRARLKTIFQNFLRDVLVRVLGTILILLYGFGYISFEQTISAMVFLYLPSLVLLTIYNIKAGYLKFSGQFKLLTNKFNELSRFSLYSVLASAGAIIVLNVDVQMVSGLAGLDANGIYTRAFYMAILIELPRRAISQIATPIIAEAFKNNDLSVIRKLYRKLSINQMVIGGLLFLGIITNLENIYAVMPNGEGYSLGTSVVYIVGIAKLLDMTFSVNGEIIVMSKYFRFGTFAITLLAGLSVLLNLLLIPVYGIAGAALASLISIFIFNTLKMVFVWRKFNLVPFTNNNLYVIAIIALTWFAQTFLPQLSRPILDIVVRSFMVTVLFCGLVVLLKVSEDINAFVERLLKKIKK